MLAVWTAIGRQFLPYQFLFVDHFAFVQRPSVSHDDLCPCLHHCPILGLCPPFNWDLSESFSFTDGPCFVPDAGDELNICWLTFILFLESPETFWSKYLYATFFLLHIFFCLLSFCPRLEFTSLVSHICRGSLPTQTPGRNRL